MKRLLAATVTAITLSALAITAATNADAQAVNMGTAGSYAVLGGSTVTNTGPSVINGDIGVSPGLVIGGFPPGVQATGVMHPGDAAAAQAQADLTIVYNALAGASTTINLSGQDLGTVGTLTAGVYAFDSSAQLTGSLTLDGQGNPNSVFIFNIGESLTTASSSSITLTNGAQGGRVFFRVGASATLGGGVGAGTQFVGRIIALTSITLVTESSITCGAALARNGAVTMDTNAINVGDGLCALISATFTDVLGPDATETERAVAAAIDLFITNGGILPPGFQALIDLLSPEQLADVLAQLAGETGTGVAPSGTRAMDSFLSQLFDSAFAEDAAGPEQPARGPGNVKALSYGPEDGPPGTRAPFGTFDGKTGRSVWASAYGSHGTTAGDALVGSHDRFDHAFGFAAGYTYRISPDTRMGVAFGVGSSTFTLADNFGSGRNDNLQVSVYGRKTFGDAYLAAALAYAFNGVSTTRFVGAPVNETFTAEVAAHNVAAQVEAGIRYGWLTPYAALRLQAFYTPAYSERSSAGPLSPFALTYDANTALAARTELGARIAGKIPLHQGASLGLHARAAWAHDFSSTSSIVASFQGLPGAPFTVQGAKAAGDSFLISAGADIAFRNGFSIGGSFDGDFSANSQNYGGKGRVRYVW